MDYLQFENSDSTLTVESKLERYNDYLKRNQGLFPKHAFEFASAIWHYNTKDSRCPHDSWVKSFEIIENDAGNRDTRRFIDIRICLLGAFHDGEITIRYNRVRSYSLDLLSDDTFDTRSHGDWILDEVRLSDAGYVLHEISFWLKANWLIEAEEIEYEWFPFDSE